MTLQDYTAVAIVVDRSGSMQDLASDVEGGIKTFVKEQRKVPGKCTIRLDQFDDVFENVYRSTPVSSAPAYKLVPRGMTALLDAMGKTITQFGEELAALPEKQRPGNVIVVVATDGFENSSREWTSPKIKELIKQQEDEYGWNFVFLAANQDAIATGASYGYAAASSLTFDATSQGVAQSYTGLSNAVTRSRVAAAAGGQSAVVFDDSERDAAKS